MNAKRKRKPRTPEQRRKHAQWERERRERWKEESRITFRCEACHGDFDVPDGMPAVGSKERVRAFVRLGGRVVCEVCARKRFRRRRDPWGVNPDAIR